MGCVKRDLNWETYLSSSVPKILCKRFAMMWVLLAWEGCFLFDKLKLRNDSADGMVVT